MTHRGQRFAGGGRAFADAAAEDERVSLLGTASRRPRPAAANDAAPPALNPPAAPAARSAWLPRVTSSPGLLRGESSSPRPPPQRRSPPDAVSAAAVTAGSPNPAAAPAPQPNFVAVSPSGVTKRRYLSGSGAAAAAASGRHHDAAAASNVPAASGYRRPPASSGGGGAAAAAAVAPATAALSARGSGGSRSPTYEAFLAMRRRTVVLINLVSIMERMDEQIVPALSRPLGCAFRAGPHQLGLITFARALVQAVASPLGGLAGHFLDRVVVLFLGCAIWGFFCTAFSFATTVNQGIAAWAFNGVGLSLIIPNSQSLVADYYTATQRGEAFGTLMLTGALGGMLGTMFATNLGGLTPMGVAGWRVAFVAVGAVSLAIGAFTLLLAADPTRHHRGCTSTRPHTRPRSRGGATGRGTGRGRHSHPHVAIHPQHGQLHPDRVGQETHGSAGAAPEPKLPGGGSPAAGSVTPASAEGATAATSTGAGILPPPNGDDGDKGAPIDAPSCFYASDEGGDCEEEGAVEEEEQEEEEGGGGFLTSPARWGGGAAADDEGCSASEEQPLMRRTRSKSFESATTTTTTATTIGLAGARTAAAAAVDDDDARGRRVSGAASASPPASPAADSAVGEAGLGRPLLRRYKPAGPARQDDARQPQGQQHRHTARRGLYGYLTHGSAARDDGAAAVVGSCSRSKSAPAEWWKKGFSRGGGGGGGGGGGAGGEVVVAGCTVEGGGYESAAAAAAAVLTSSPTGRPALTWQRIWRMITTPTFLIIILQGIVGSTPWNALVFLTLYLQLIGFSDATASSLMALFLGGTAAGALVGGWLGDRVAERYPHHGRVALVQFSVGIGVPLAVLMMRGLPMTATPGTAVLYAAVMLLKGVLTSWAAPACNNPVFAEIVPPDMRNLVYAFDRSFEGAISALGAPLVGMAAERWFGFSGVAGGDQACEHHNAMAGTDPDLPKARALGDAMLLFMAVPWTLCALFYTGLHWSYPRDRARALRPQVVLEVSEGHGGRSRGTPSSVVPYKVPYRGAGGRTSGKLDV